jgi:signal transduction histidine kinase/DNA-binding NarL/FixJ family response regulator
MSTLLRLLILEDQPDDAELMRRELRLSGFELDAPCVDNETAYLARLDPAPDVILSDFHMVNFDALRALSLLQARGLDVPFIVVSGSLSDEAAVECIKRGAADYLLKDRLSRLGPAVRRALEEKRLRDEARAAESETLRQAARATSLLRVAARLNAGLDLDAMLTTVCAETACAFNVPIAAVHLYDEKRDALYPAGSYGIPPAQLQSLQPMSRAVYDAYASQFGPVIVFPDVRAIPELPNPEWRAAANLRLLAIAGMLREGRLVGALSIATPEARRFTDDELTLLRGLADQAALAIANALQHARMQRRLKESEALSAITRALNETLDLERILQMIVDAGRQIIPQVERAVIHLLNEEKQALHPAAVSGQIEQLGRPDFSMRPGEGIAGQVIAEGAVINVSDIQTEPRYLRLGRATHLRSLLVAPVLSGAHRLGTISVQSGAPNAFSADDERLLAMLGVHAGLAIENARLYTDLEKALHYEKAARARLVQSEKLAAMGRLVASVAHELNNPLQAIQNALYLVKQDSQLDPQAREDLQVALIEADRMADLISRLRETYRPTQAEQFRLESLNALVEEVQKLISTHLRHGGVTFIFEADPSLPPVPGIRDQLKQVILNLCLNAVEAMPTGGWLTIQTRYLSEVGQALMKFSDTGAGIDPANLPNIFDPFFTTKESGTGLGLAITYDIIQRHGGRVDVESQVGRGTTFRVWLPVDKAPITVQNSPALSKA